MPKRYMTYIRTNQFRTWSHRTLTFISMLTKIGTRTLPTGCFSVFWILYQRQSAGWHFVYCSWKQQQLKVFLFCCSVTLTFCRLSNQMLRLMTSSLLTIYHLTHLKVLTTLIEIRLILSLCLRGGWFPWRPEKRWHSRLQWLTVFFSVFWKVVVWFRF